MRKLYESILGELRGLHAEVVTAIESLPAEALDWSPGPEMNSLTVLAVHLSGAERYWIGDVVRGDPSFRDRAAEFQVKGLQAEALKNRLQELDMYEEKALGEMRLRDLDETRISPRDGRKVTAGWALLHTLQHAAVHVGHIEILVQLWKQRETQKEA
jgi:uncharacterized damage-inducible protein DinB